MHYPVTIQNFSMRSFSQKIEILYQLFPGLVSYLLVTGGGGLNPFSFGWLVTANQSNLDSAQNYLGWDFSVGGLCFNGYSAGFQTLGL
jgi:hypothetical protein